MSNNVYPSIEELIPPIMEAKLPKSLVDELTERYQTLGEKYLTEQFHTDGRRINGMMFTHRNENCREEIVDAVFCLLGWVFKILEKNENIEVPDSVNPAFFYPIKQEVPQSIFVMLDGLIQIYGMLKAEEYNGTYS